MEGRGRGAKGRMGAAGGGHDTGAAPIIGGLRRPGVFTSLAMTADVAAGLQDYVDTYYRPEPKRRARPASFRRPEDR